MNVVKKKLKKNRSLIPLLTDRQMNDKCRSMRSMKDIVHRSYFLHNLIPNDQILSHIFLGFTQNGQHLLSYCFELHSLNLFIWNFNYKDRLTLIGKHCIYTCSSLADDLVESTGLSVYQWPSDDRHLLALTIPDYSSPSVINLTIIYFDQSQSYILKPGFLTYGVIDWGCGHHLIRKLTTKLATKVNKSTFEDCLTPGLLLFNKSVFAFTTGTEVVCIKICRIENENTAIATVLDIEKVLFEKVDMHRLMNYEIIVRSIDCSPTIVSIYVNTVLSESWTSTAYKDFQVKWFVEKGCYNIDECDHTCRNGSKENLHFILEQLVQSEEPRKVYLVDNTQFMDSQTSLEVIKSPVDNVFISLSLDS